MFWILLAYLPIMESGRGGVSVKRGFWIHPDSQFDDAVCFRIVKIGVEPVSSECDQSVIKACFQWNILRERERGDLCGSVADAIVSYTFFILKKKIIQKMLWSIWEFRANDKQINRKKHTRETITLSMYVYSLLHNIDWTTFLVSIWTIQWIWWAPIYGMYTYSFQLFLALLSSRW